MGWKNFKEKYNINHIVHVVDNHIVIGANFMPVLLRINMENGKIVEELYASSLNLSLKSAYEELKNLYPDLFNDSPKERLNVIKTEDNFVTNYILYTFDEDGNIIEKESEGDDFPSVTNDGTLIYSNMFFKEKSQAYNKAFKNFENHSKYFSQNIKKLEDELKSSKKSLLKNQNILSKLLKSGFIEE